MATKTRRAAAPQTADDYMALPYRIEVYYDEDYWAAECADLPGFAAAADTWEELQAKIEDAKRSWFDAALAAGIEIRPPRPVDEPYSGKFVVRIPKSLHAAVVQAADREGVSLNTLVVAAIAKELGWRQ